MIKILKSQKVMYKTCLFSFFLNIITWPLNNIFTFKNKFICMKKGRAKKLDPVWNNSKYVCLTGAIIRLLIL